MRHLLILLLPIVALVVQLPANRAQADQISLDFQHAQIVKLAKPAKSVIVGDPYVVDITMEDPTTLVLFGKQPGITNLVVMDQNSDILLNWPVMVRDATDNRVSVISPGQERVYEAIWMCTDQNRCTRIPGASDISPFKYNATSASTNPNTGSSGGGNNNNNNNNNNNGGTGTENNGGGTNGGGTAETPPPAN